ESAFWLAEHDFSKKDFAQAKTEYLELAKRSPDSPRAAQARQWAEWLEQREGGWREGAMGLAELGRRAAGENASLSLTLSKPDDDPAKAFQGRLAFRDPRHFYLSIAYGKSGFLLANNEDGTWYRALDQRQALRARQTLELPLPNLGVTASEEDKLSFQFGWAIGDSRPVHPQPVFTLAPTVLPALVSRLQGTVHLCKLTEK